MCTDSRSSVSGRMCDERPDRDAGASRPPLMTQKFCTVTRSSSTELTMRTPA